MTEDGQRVLVTGGAGYIGSHACKALRAAGFVPVAFDNLSTGHGAAVKYGPLVEGDLLDRGSIDAALAAHAPIAVFHFAALSQVGDSMAEPGRYWRENVGGALNLIEATVAAGIRKFVFSSTCATYGDQDGVVLTEDTDQRPINAYGGSKLAIEQMLADFARKGLESVIFRYFNVAGADPDAEVGEHHDPETHLVPLLLDAIAGRRGPITVFGTDYGTPDGTAIRDYVHVSDLADAHVKGLSWLLDGKGSRTFCLGTGTGFSVREVIDAAKAVTNAPVPHSDGPRRDGDATRLVCGSERAQRELGWRPERSDMATMLRDAHRWHQKGGF
ncbi:MAG: UDP-glucose 4-epimerase GalE [Pseudomonadota bacterium]